MRVETWPTWRSGSHGGLLYGTTAHGGVSPCGGSGCGMVFQVDPTSGAEAMVYGFKNRLEGEDPEGGLVFRNGLLFGTTETGGRSSRGTVFSVDPRAGSFTLIHDLEGPRDGANPGTLIVRSGALFGTTSGESAAGFGTVFQVTR